MKIFKIAILPLVTALVLMCPIRAISDLGDDESWIYGEGRQKPWYRALSESENIGLYYCSVKGRVVDIVISEKHKAISITFKYSGPVNVEISSEAREKLAQIQLDRVYKVFCIHSFFRDDWQEVYDRDKQVWGKFLEIELAE